MSAEKSSNPARAKSAQPSAESFDALRRRESVRNGLVRLGRRHAHAALHRIVHPKKADRTEDIHHVRVQCKRLRALLRLLKPVTDVEAVKRENLRLRDAARMLSGFRDAFVAGETLKRVFEDTAPRQMRDAARLLGVKRRPPKNKQDLDLALAQAAKSLRRTAEGFRTLPFSTRGWAAIAPGLENSYRRARKEYHRCLDRGAGHLGDCFHAWRKRVKDLGYQLEILENIQPGDTHRLRKEVRRLGALLGDDHDYLVFAEQVRARERHYLDLANFRPVRKRLRRRLKTLRGKEFAIARHFFADKPRLWIARLAENWRLWKNPDTGALVLTIEQPEPPTASPRSLGAPPVNLPPVQVQ
jgi:CHAD domain-containing protein